MHIIRTIFFSLLMVNTINVHAMEAPTSSWHILADDAITQIAAICGSKARNQLMHVSKSLRYLASKENVKILHCSPLDISEKDTIYYFIIGSLKNDFTLLKNLIINNKPNLPRKFAHKASSAIELTTETIIQSLLNNYHARIISLSDATPDYILAVYDSQKPSSSFFAVYHDDYIKKHFPPIDMDHSDLLLAATHDRREDVVKYLLTYGTIQINKKNIHGNNALHLATIHGLTNIIKILLTHPDINIHERRDLENLTALHIAVAKGNVDIIKLLLAYDETQLDQEANHECKALHIAANNGHAHCVKYLLIYYPKKVNVNARAYRERTALFMAIIEEHIDVIKALLNHPNINVNVQADEGDTALHWAVLEGNIDIIKALLVHPDIDVNIKDNNDETALQITQRQRRREIDNPVLYQEIKDLLVLASAK